MPSRPQFDIRAVAGALAIFSPISIALGNVASEATVSAVAILFIGHCIQSRDWSWGKQPHFALFLALWVYSIARSLVADVTFSGIGTALTWVRFILFAAALGTWLLPDETIRRRMAVAAMASVAFMASDALLQKAVGHDIIGRPLSGSRLTAEFPRPIVGISIVWLFLPPLAVLLTWRRYLLAAAFAVLAVSAVELSGERVAFLICIASLLALLSYVGEIRRRAVAIVAVALLTLAALFAFSPTLFQRQVVSTWQTVTNLADSHYGIIWSSAWRIAEDRPVLGVGLRNYNTACLNPAYGPETVDNWPRCSTHPHNVFLQWLTETGVGGLVLFAAACTALLIALGAPLWRQAANPILFAVFTMLCLRFWPVQSNTSFFIAWSAVPLFLLAGWGLSYRETSKPA